MLITEELTNYIKKGKFAVFCGAGISFHSGFPLVASLTRHILTGIKLNPADVDEIIAAKLPFEAFAGVLAEESGSLRFLKIYENGKPNQDHYFLAALAKAGKIKVIVTTNFDTLIEQALDSEGLKKSADYLVYYQENDFEKIAWDTEKLILIKIHGSIQSKRNMAVTLERISQSPLTVGRKKIIENLFTSGKHEEVMVLGYSFSDVFDIIPQIASLPSLSKKIVVIQHTPGLVKARVTKPKAKSKMPFEKAANCSVIKIDTDALIQQLALLCISQPLPANPLENNRWIRQVDHWLEDINRQDKSAFSAIAGKLFYLKSNFEKAAVHFEAALSSANTEAKKCNHLRNMGIVSKELGHYKKALAYLFEAETIAGRLKDKKPLISTLNNIAYTYGAQEDQQTASEYQVSSLKMAKKIKNKKLMAINYNNLGIILGAQKHYEEALINFDKALKWMDRIGYVQWEARTINNVGIAKRLLHRLDESLGLHQRALQLSEQLGFTDERTLSLENMARTYFESKNYDLAIKNIKTAISLTKETGNKGTRHKCFDFLSKNI